MSSKILTRYLPLLALLLAHAIWGVNFVVAKVTLQEFPPMTLAFLRFGIASLLLVPFLFAARKKNLPAGRQVHIKKEDLPKLIAIGVFIITLNIAFFFEGIKRTAATDASLLTLIIPILSVLFGWWFLKEKISITNLIGVLVGLLGAMIIIGLPQIIIGTISVEAIIGNILIILASVSFVIGATISKKILSKYSTLLVTAIAFGVGTVTFLVPAGFEYMRNPEWISQVTILGILGLIYMTLLSSISAYFLFEWGLSKTNVIVADLFQYIEPLIATTLGVAILAEKVSVSFFTGAFLIAAGVYLGTVAKEAHHRHRKPHRI